MNNEWYENMLDYIVKERKTEYVSFYFYPEGSNNPGVVVFYSDGKVEITENSVDDVKGYYASHAVSGINKEKDEGYVIWY